MTDFIVVVAAAAMLAGSAPAPGVAPPAPGTTAGSVALSAPTVGFRTYSDAASCEEATAAMVAPVGARLVCIPVEPMAGDMANAY